MGKGEEGGGRVREGWRKGEERKGEEKGRKGGEVRGIYIERGAIPHFPFSPLSKKIQ